MCIHGNGTESKQKRAKSAANKKKKQDEIQSTNIHITHRNMHTLNIKMPKTVLVAIRYIHSYDRLTFESDCYQNFRIQCEQ